MNLVILKTAVTPNVNAIDKDPIGLFISTLRVAFGGSRKLILFEETLSLIKVKGLSNIFHKEDALIS